MPSDSHLTLAALISALESRFPASWAEGWDNVGLVTGEPAAALSGALVTLDATGSAVERAAAAGAGVIVTHHPPYLEAPERHLRADGPLGTIEAALRLGIGVIALHTNLDRSPAGATALPALIGVRDLEPLEEGTEPVSMIVTYAPQPDVERIREAMASAGAGRLGTYEDCAFTSAGTGHFTPSVGSTPALDAVPQGVDEVRIEMLAPRERAGAVVTAAASAHPYEEPVVVALEGVRARGVARLGRIGTWEGGTVADLAAHIDRVLGCRVRVWGDADWPAHRVATANGSASSLVRAVIGRADVLVAGEVRYHEALDAVASGCAVIEAGHDMTEWPMVRVLADAVREIGGPGFTVVEETPQAGWWVTEGAHDRR